LSTAGIKFLSDWNEAVGMFVVPPIGQASSGQALILEVHEIKSNVDVCPAKK
jgi:hypothetical protein